MSVVLFGPKRPAEGEPEAYDAPEAAEPAERAPHTNPARLPFIEFSIDNVRIVSEVGENQYDKEQPYTKRLYEDPIIFEIEVTLVAPIADPDIEWTAKFCTGDEQDDQVLDTVITGLDHVQSFPSTFRFHFEVPAPDASKLPEEDLLGNNLVKLFVSYKDQVFRTIGWYVNGSYEQDDFAPEKPRPELIMRKFMEENMRFTNYPIVYTPLSAEAEPLYEHAGAAARDDGGAEYARADESEAPHADESWAPGAFGALRL